MVNKKEFETLKNAVYTQHKKELKKENLTELNIILKRCSKKQLEKLFKIKQKLNGIATAHKKRLFVYFFGFDMPTDYMIEMISGKTFIDVIKFDKMIKTPKGISTYNHVEKAFGIDALKFLKSII